MSSLYPLAKLKQKGGIMEEALSELGIEIPICFCPDCDEKLRV